MRNAEKIGVPVIILSGYAIDGDAEATMGRKGNGFIQKPFNISEISQKVRDILDEAKNNSPK